MITVVMCTLVSVSNGRVTAASSVVRKQVIHAMSAWAFNGSSGVLNNNNNKYNARQVRAACALGEDEIGDWMGAYFDCIAIIDDEIAFPDHIVGRKYNASGQVTNEYPSNFVYSNEGIMTDFSFPGIVSTQYNFAHFPSRPSSYSLFIQLFLYIIFVAGFFCICQLKTGPQI